MPETVYNPFTGADEILFKDVDGQLKVLREGQVEPWRPPVPSHSVARTEPSAVVPALPDPSEQTVDQIVGALRISLSDGVLQQRLRSLVRSRCKDVRDAMETREALVRPAKVGGLGITPEQAEDVLKVIEQRVQAFGEGKRQAQDQTLLALEANVGLPARPAPAPPAHAPLTPLTLTVPPQTPPPPPAPGPVARKSVGAVAVPSTPLRPATAQPSRPHGVPPLVVPFPPPPQTPQPVEPPVVVVAPAPWLPIAPPVVPIPPAASAVATAQAVPERQPFAPVADTGAVPAVRFRPKLVGPVEELQELTVTDFRRLDADAANATQRLREKIALLEQQSFGHKAAAIAAWRKSEVFARYAELAAAAMAEKRTIADVIANRPNTGGSTLTAAEFEAIADFNRTLRF